MNSTTLTCFISLLLSLQQGGSVAPANQEEEEFEVNGRAVLYDWEIHGLGDFTFEEDLVIRLSEPKAGLPLYIHVVYVGVAYQAPDEIKAKYRLNQRLFIGRGDSWRFRLFRPSPKGMFERYCNRNYAPVEVTDDLGSIEIPRFFPTPGALEEDVPPIDSLPCFVTGWHPKVNEPESKQRRQ